MVTIAILIGSDSDRQIAERTIKVLDNAGIDYDIQVLSAHRNPVELEDYIQKSDAQVFIAIAGLSAALPGVVASRTKKPVIGVPVSSKLGGLDALLSIVQMPKGVPVACVGIDNGENAAYLALRILGKNSRLDKDQLTNRVTENNK
ncbi:MAG: phosphoribosylaminoimidazole carboxylase [Candidatus Methanoperedens nitroreducens]|uniref:N5-carboxyaminoimidazole ribonucleotide mutase n=1 Tax=Candidatus Methanoperedens nitratireducens TaxID=1392998 RepID=A0A0P7ZAA0_9EURY|nr:5-(carboxyamino)imidazole ribonucleotide mutase [Candidatus Methanoperedens sp. BLZ2]KAB2945040.1 MAG: 5-(carboxyamino)imidazole ribonucleotide mutase [Candidatus Methanoperedens sp.]KPQ41401.1 MAG: phosphoribosylaminoimidazole carboxylase [Candidatus Methanoperedens sp. BLZ1]MBZ0176620.1 5-(carboxyamino)imidazole ribonucleotide mutase [Candidatus Methanoperedens nitroreducens]MCX9080344.1 5-(carboxyamino)imidazole ribonucleotide mutase [Candidatus Methanoperedens sp.]